MNLAVTQRRAKLADTVRRPDRRGLRDAELKAAGAGLARHQGRRRSLQGCRADQRCGSTAAPNEPMARTARLRLRRLQLHRKCCEMRRPARQEVHLDHRRRRLGLRHRLRRTRPRARPGEDVNVLVLDTEVYSNTGGQASKSTPDRRRRQVRRRRQAHQEEGPRHDGHELRLCLRRAGRHGRQPRTSCSRPCTRPKPTTARPSSSPTAPCINHGINMGYSPRRRSRRRSTAGYWPLYRYNPALADEGKNPFTLDSKEPTASYQDFIKGEVRYSTLVKPSPRSPRSSSSEAEKEAGQRLSALKKMAAD